MLKIAHGRSFLTRIWLVILASFFVLVVSVYITLQVYYRGMLQQNTEMQYQYEDEIRCQNIYHYAKTVNSCCNTIILHINSSLEDVDRVNGYPSLRTITQKKIYHGLINTFKMFKDPIEAAIVWNNGVCFYQGQFYSMYAGEGELISELNQLSITRQGVWITGIHSKSRLHGDGLYFVKPYTDIETGKVTGYVLLKLNADNALLDDSSGTRTFYLFDRNGALLQTNDAQAQAQLFSAVTAQQRLDVSAALHDQLALRKGEKRTYIGESAIGNGWELLSVSDMRGINHGLNATIGIILALCLGVLTLLFGMLWVVITRTIRPVRQLSDHMMRLDSMHPTPLNARHSDDEIGVLIDQYNQMICKNNEMFQQILEGKQRQKQLEFSLLQAQIKPHFLYNSLDAIYCLNAVGRYDEAKSMTKLLSEYYRLSLNKGMELVSLWEEVEMARIYLEIQSVRYRRILSFSIEYPEKAFQINIPKLTLQPLVENAIYHGIKPTGRAGRVRITVRSGEDDGVVEIRVIDDGGGFPLEQFQKILQADEPHGEHGYGLRNVAERLRIYYADRCQFLLEPAQTGTTILIRIQDASEVNGHV